jgi:hypothetical protein
MPSITREYFKYTVGEITCAVTLFWSMDVAPNKRHIQSEFELLVFCIACDHLHESKPTLMVIV